MKRRTGIQRNGRTEAPAGESAAARHARFLRMRVELGNVPMKRLFTSSSWSLAIKVAAAGTSYLFLVILSHWLNAEAYGVFAVALSLAIFATPLASGGQPTLSLRFLSELSLDDKGDVLGRFLLFSYLTCVACALAVGSLLVIGGAAAEERGATKIAAFVHAAAPMLVMLCLLEMQTNHLRGFANISLALLPRDILWRLGSLVVLWFAFTRMGGAPTALQTALVVSGMIFLLAAVQFGGILSYGRRFGIPIGVPRRADLRRWFPISARMSVSASVGAALIYTDTIVLGMLLAADVVGDYFNAARSANLLSLGLIAVNQVGAPLLSRAYYDEGVEALQRQCKQLMRLVALPTIAIFVLAVALGPTILSLFGGNSERYYAEFVILSFGYLVNALAGPAAVVAQLIGWEITYAKVMGVCLLFLVVTLVVFIPLVGTLAAAIATALAWIVWNAVLVSALWRRLKLDTSIGCLFR